MTQGTRLTTAYAEINSEIESTIARLQAQKWARIQELMRIKGSKEKYPSAFLQKKYEELLENPKPISAGKDHDHEPASVAVVISNFRESTSSDSSSEDEDDARAGVADWNNKDMVAVKDENNVIEIKDEDDVMVIKDEDDVKQEEVKDPLILKTERL